MVWTDDTERQALNDIAEHKAVCAEVERIIAEARRADVGIPPLHEYSLYAPGVLPPKVAGIDWVSVAAWVGAAAICGAGWYGVFWALPVVGGWLRRAFG